MKVTLRENESFEELMRRFKREVNKSDILYECKKRQFYLPKALKRKEKGKHARALLKK